MPEAAQLECTELDVLLSSKKKTQASKFNQIFIQNSQLSPVQVCHKTLKSSGTGGPPSCQRLDILSLTLARMTYLHLLALARLTCSHLLTRAQLTCSYLLALAQLTCSKATRFHQLHSYYFGFRECLWTMCRENGETTGKAANGC